MGDRSWPAIHVDVGNPHAVVMVDDLAEAGRLYDEPAYDEGLYPDGVNVEFVVRRGPDHIAMRVHERGSGETRSCGTGACAAAVARPPVTDRGAGGSTYLAVSSRCRATGTGRVPSPAPPSSSPAAHTDL